MESPTLARVKKTREAFDEKDSAASQIAHDATLKDWEEDGHNSGAHAEACYRRVDAAQVGLCAAIVLESALGGDVSGPRLLSLALTLALAYGLREATARLWYARHYTREHGRETWELDNYAKGEREEMVGLWMFKGLARPDAERVIATLSDYKAFFLAACVALGAALPLCCGGLAAACAPAVAGGAYGASLDGSSPAGAASFATFAAATAALAWTGGWRASFSRLAYTRHALESASVGFACLLLPKLCAALVA
ncbi:pyruvate carboxylase [Aureococcus anophagefferens]|nr:pyruvate carboxylase [Aureococcus anophagefferens]